MIGILLTSATLSGLCGEYGFDANHGKCHLVECDRCSRYFNYEGKCVPHIIINTIGIGIPFLIILVSYTIVFIKLRTYANEDGTREYKISTIVLTCCYFVFILPVFMVEWIPPKVGDKERGFRYWEPFNQTFNFFQALIVAIIYSVYWLVYVVNVFVYVIYLPRCRDAICFMVKDLASPVTDRLNAATIGHSHTTWGPQVADRTLQEYTLSGINQDSNDFECTRF